MQKHRHVLFDVAGGKKIPLRELYLTDVDANSRNLLLAKTKRGMLWEKVAVSFSLRKYLNRKVR